MNKLINFLRQFIIRCDDYSIHSEQNLTASADALQKQVVAGIHSIIIPWLNEHFLLQLQGDKTPLKQLSVDAYTLHVAEEWIDTLL